MFQSRHILPSFSLISIKMRTDEDADEKGGKAKNHVQLTQVIENNILNTFHEKREHLIFLKDVQSALEVIQKRQEMRTKRKTLRRKWRRKKLFRTLSWIV